jgi:acyl-CoA thioesterase-1
MIIMRSIILAFSIVALTACDATDGRTDGRTAAPRGTDVGAEPAAAPPGAAGSAATTRTDTDAGRRTVLFVGTSLTAGYGVGDDVAFPALIQQKIDAAGLPYRVVNAGISGETSAGGLRRIDWSLQQPVDVLVLELGANDALRGLDVDEMRANLDSILVRARRLHPGIGIVILGMEAPPNLGPRYTARFRESFPALARRYDAALVPFLLEGVAADPELNLEDGIHPSPAGHSIIARTVWSELEPVLRTRAAALMP